MSTKALNAVVPDTVQTVLHHPKDHSLSLESHPSRIPSQTQYLIRVLAVGITKGELLWPEPNTLEHPIPGYDVSGVVIQSPALSSRFQPGDKIYAMTGAERPANAREITVVEESEIAGMPEGLSAVEAAAVPMSALTAREALFERGGFEEVRESERNNKKSLLVIGASGAVGIWAVQLAKWAGVGRIVGVCGTSNVDFVTGLGAHEIIDHRSTSVRRYLEQHGGASKFDLVLDGVGEDGLVDAWMAVKAGGQLISYAEPPESRRPSDGASDGVKGSFFIVDWNGKKLAKITKLIEEGVVKPVVDQTFPLQEFQKAFGRVESGRARGKVIIELG